MKTAVFITIVAGLALAANAANLRVIREKVLDDAWSVDAAMQAPKSKTEQTWGKGKVPRRARFTYKITVDEVRSDEPSNEYEVKVLVAYNQRKTKTTWVNSSKVETAEEAIKPGGVKVWKFHTPTTTWARANMGMNTYPTGPWELGVTPSGITVELWRKGESKPIRTWSDIGSRKYKGSIANVVRMCFRENGSGYESSDRFRRFVIEPASFEDAQ